MKTVLITGCNRGLGKTLVESFAKEGYNIIALIRKQSDEFDAFTENLCKECGITISKYYAEFSEEASLIAALDEIEASGVCIDVLVNNAGVNLSTSPIFNTDYADVEMSFKVNYLSVFAITKRIAYGMIRNNCGSIINISSTISLNPGMAESCYGSSKAALNLFTESVAQELAPFNVRMNAIACGVMNTDMFSKMDDKAQKKSLKRIGFKRPAELNEIAEMALFLASEKSSYITGAILKVDGGFV